MTRKNAFSVTRSPSVCVFKQEDLGLVLSTSKRHHPVFSEAILPDIALLRPAIRAIEIFRYTRPEPRHRSRIGISPSAHNLRAAIRAYVHNAIFTFIPIRPPRKAFGLSPSIQTPPQHQLRQISLARARNSGSFNVELFSAIETLVPGRRESRFGF